MWKKPSLISALIFIIFLAINPFRFQKLEGSFEYIRFFYTLFWIVSFGRILIFLPMVSGSFESNRIVTSC